jgi:serine/threonine-protein kinase
MPDSERILYSSTRDGEGGIFRRAANGTGQEEQITTGTGNLTGTGNQFPNSISGDGRYLFFVTDGDMFTMSLEGEREIAPTAQTTFNEGWNSLSPDGRWLAYLSNETGRFELYVRPFPDVDSDRWQISTNGAWSDRVLWAPDGSELYYVSEDDEYLAVAIETETTFSWSSAEVLFPWDQFSAPLGISPDGERFLAIRTNAEADDGSGATSIAFVDNWFDELRRLAPAE